MQKLHDQTYALSKSSLSEKDKKWLTIIIPDFMSSEDSCSDSGNHLVKRELPWRSSKVSNFFTELDTFTDDSKSCMAKRQTWQRILDGEVSSRGVPSGKFPSWALTSGTHA